MSCHFPLLSPFIPLKPAPQHSRVHLLVGLESGWPWDSNAWIGEYSLFYLGTASAPTSAQIRDVLKQGFSLRAPRMPLVTKLSEPEVASAFGCRPEAIMFCQLISADTPPRLISNIGYFENDRIFPSHLSFNSMRAAPHPCHLAAVQILQFSSRIGKSPVHSGIGIAMGRPYRAEHMAVRVRIWPCFFFL